MKLLDRSGYGIVDTSISDADKEALRKRDLSCRVKRVSAACWIILLFGKSALVVKEDLRSVLTADSVTIQAIAFDKTDTRKLESRLAPGSDVSVCRAGEVVRLILCRA